MISFLDEPSSTLYSAQHLGHNPCPNCLAAFSQGKPETCSISTNQGQQQPGESEQDEKRPITFDVDYHYQRMLPCQVGRAVSTGSWEG